MPKIHKNLLDIFPALEKFLSHGFCFAAFLERMSEFGCHCIWPWHSGFLGGQNSAQFGQSKLYGNCDANFKIDKNIFCKINSASSKAPSVTYGRYCAVRALIACSITLRSPEVSASNIRTSASAIFRLYS